MTVDTIRSRTEVTSKSKCRIRRVSRRRRCAATKTRIVLALTSRLLRDCLCSLLAEEPDMEVVGSEADPVDVLITTGRTRAHVVILSCPLLADGPGICTHLLAEYPDVQIIGIPEAQGVVSLAGLLAAIRSVVSGTASFCIGFSRSVQFSR